MHLSRGAWFVILIVTLVAFVFAVVSNLVSSESYDWAIVVWLRGWLSQFEVVNALVHTTGRMMDNNLLSDVVFLAVGGIVSLAITYIKKIPSLRRVGVQMLVDGYFNNFLKKVIGNIYAQTGEHEKRVAIILPGFNFLTDKEMYWSTFQTVLARRGFELAVKETDIPFGRHIFTIYSKEGSEQPIFIDLPTTMTGLKKLIEFETGITRGDMSNHKWASKRFYQLREQFRNELEKYAQKDDWGNLTFIDGTTRAEYEQEIDRFLENLPSNNQ